MMITDLETETTTSHDTSQSISTSLGASSAFARQSPQTEPSPEIQASVWRLSQPAPSQQPTMACAYKATRDVSLSQRIVD